MRVRFPCASDARRGPKLWQKQAWARAGRAMNIETRWDFGAGSLGFLTKHRPDAGVNRCSEDIWALACQRAADHGGDAALSPRRLPHVSGEVGSSGVRGTVFS